MNYKAEFEHSVSDPASYWSEKMDLISWFSKPTTSLSKDENGNDVWFRDGVLNTSYLALDYHIEQGRGDQVALIYDSPVTDVVEKFTWTALQNEVARFAGALSELGVVKGDRVIIYMPMFPPAVISMLACARIGAIHSVVFGGFAARELATRIDDARPRVIVSASCGIEFTNVIPYQPLVKEAISLATHEVEYNIVCQRPQMVAPLSDKGSDKRSCKDLDWSTLMEDATPVEPVHLASDDPLYILYTSGTTGKPKGVVRDNGGHALALSYSMQYLYGADPGDVFWAASDVGWVVGHSYIVYGPLIRGCTTVLFEGKPVRTPDAGTFWRVISDHGVNIFFTAPTGFRAIKKEDPEGKLLKGKNLSSLKRLFVAGERTDPPTYHWLKDMLKIPVIDHWWQTETGWPIATNPVGIEEVETRAGSANLPVPGYDVQILSPDHKQLENGNEGDVVVKLPLPPGCLPTVWGDHQRYISAYLKEHPGFFNTGDEGYKDVDGYLYIMGRTDDVINVAGHRLSTGAMEEIVASHAAVAECAVFGVADADKGQVPLGLIVLKDGVNVTHSTLQEELIAMMRKEVGAFANFRRAVIVKRLPKTRSGKILRKTLRSIADGKAFDVPATIDDPAILTEITDSLTADSLLDSQGGNRA